RSFEVGIADSRRDHVIDRAALRRVEWISWRCIRDGRAFQLELHDLAGATCLLRRLSIPEGNEDLTVPGHERARQGILLVASLAGQPDVRFALPGQDRQL